MSIAPLPPVFPIRGWESQLEDFWCRWKGGSPDWFSNEQYLAYLRDAFSRAPQYGINTFLLMGRGDQGELHTFVDFAQWERLQEGRSAAAQRQALEQAQVLEALAGEALPFGVRLFLWDHELQVPRGFADLYPEARGQGVPLCPSSPLVWRLLADKYDEFFSRVPTLAGIALVFAETQVNLLRGSRCQCEACAAASGVDLVRRIIETALEACRRHGRQLFVRTFGHGWEEMEVLFAAIRAIEPPESFVVMSKMVPWDFFGFQQPPCPSTVALRGRPRILEDAVGGEFRGKTHALCLPAEYYARHLRHAAAHGASGAVFRLDHSAYPRSVFDTPLEFNVWLTSRLLQDPYQSLEDLWQEWACRRYGQEAGPRVVEALRCSADIWEHSTNTFGFYCTSAHGHIAPFFQGYYNAYENLVGTAQIRTYQRPELEQRLRELLHPDARLLDEIVAEREQAVAWAIQSQQALEEARPYLSAEDCGELAHYLALQLEAARLWRELGDLFFTGLAILRSEGLPPALLERLCQATQRALLQGRRLEARFGRGHWPVAPDADGRGIRLEQAIAGLWGEWLDRLLGLELLPPGDPTPRAPRTDAEQLYLALLETAASLGEREVALAGSLPIARLCFVGDSLLVESSSGHTLTLPVAAPVRGPVLKGGAAVRLRIQPAREGVQVEVIPEPAWKAWVQRRLLPTGEGEAMMARFVERHLQPLPLPASREEWLIRRETLRQEILRLLGLDDLVPPGWDLGVQHRGTLRRQGYRIEKVTFESYPGMAVPALLYVPDDLSGRVPGLVSMAGHVYGEGKAAVFLQQRNANLALRGCVVLAYDYLGCGERNTGPDPRGGQPYGGGNDHGISSFSFSRRTPTGLEVFDAIRALDLLASRPEVDPGRLGFTGESGGGNSTYWAAALDPRIRLAVPVSAVTTFDYWIRFDRNWDWHQRPFGIRRLADIGVLLALHAPAPLLVISSRRGTDDWEFPWEEAEKSVAWARQVYSLLGAGEAIAHLESETGHGYQEDKRCHLYRWVEDWLQPPFPRGEAELPVEVESFADLRCGLPEGNRTCRDLYAEWLTPLPRGGADWQRFLGERLGLPDPLPPVSAERTGTATYGPWQAEFWLLSPEPGIRLPGLFLRGAVKERTLVLVPGRDERIVDRHLQAGRSVFAFDLRGTGEIADGGGMVRNWAWFAGRPWPGLRAFDLLQVARFWAGQFPGSPILVDAPGECSWPALLAGAVAPHLFQPAAEISLPGFREVLQSQGDAAALAEVPGLFEHLDVPQLWTLWSRGDRG